MRFLKLGLEDRVPDSKRIWLLRGQLATAGLMGQLFKQFDRYLTINGYSARKGQIEDASIVSVSGISNIPEKQMLEKESRYKKEISTLKEGILLVKRKPLQRQLRCWFLKKKPRRSGGSPRKIDFI